MNKIARAKILLIPVSLMFLLTLSPKHSHGQDSPAPSMDQLEEELSLIEEEIISLEKKVDRLLEDLVDPKVTSMAIFFSSANLVGGIPVALELKLDDLPLVTRELSETDRLVLLRGGAVEVFSGMIDPEPQNLSVRCHLASDLDTSLEERSAQSIFKISPQRSSANFIEVSLSAGRDKKEKEFELSARHWSKEL